MGLCSGCLPGAEIFSTNIVTASIIHMHWTVAHTFYSNCVHFPYQWLGIVGLPNCCCWLQCLFMLLVPPSLAIYCAIVKPFPFLGFFKMSPRICQGNKSQSRTSRNPLLCCVTSWERLQKWQRNSRTRLGAGGSTTASFKHILSMRYRSVLCEFLQEMPSCAVRETL